MRYLEAKEEHLVRKMAEIMADHDRARGRRTWVVYEAVTRLALGTGARVSELAALKCGDLVFANGGVAVRLRRLKRREKAEDLQKHGRHMAAFLRRSTELLDQLAAPAEGA